MLLQQLIGKWAHSANGHAGRVQKVSRKKAEKTKRARAERADDNSADTKTDSRCVQVKSAVRRSEKHVFEALATKRETTLSDLIRDFLLQEAKRERLL